MHCMNKVFYILFIGSVYVFSHGRANMRVYKHLFGCYTFTDNREKYYMIILGIDPGYAILGWELWRRPATDSGILPTEL